MPEGLGPQDMLRFWQENQRTFWTAAAGEPAFENASAFAPPDWQAFDTLVEHLLAGLTPEGHDLDLAAIHAAQARYRDVIAATWVRIRTAFEAHRRAVWDPASPIDWRVLRDRWFQIAEAEFIQTQRSPAFLEAQRGVIRAASRLWTALPAEAREAVALQRRTGQTMLSTVGELGLDPVPIAATPKQTIWQAGKTTLSRYHPLDGLKHTLGPVLICHGLIGRQSMTDLRPERSIVRNLLAQGVDVFVVDWGNAGPEDAGQGLDHFVGDRFPTLVAETLAAADVETLTLFGICQGGTLAAIHAARDPKGLNGLITAVAPFDFHADAQDADPSHGLLNLWLRGLEPEDVEGLLAVDGNLSGAFMGLVFNQLNPVRTLAKYAIEMLDTLDDPTAVATFMAMETWLADRPDLPGAMARTWITDLYHDNALVAGRLGVLGARINLSDIPVPVLNIFATGDHIIPPPCSRALGAHLHNTQYTELALPSGHIGAFVSARTQVLLAPAVVSFLQEHGAP